MNTQPIEKATDNPDGVLDVRHIWKTIQGEGPHVGRPAVFIRLAGCNLQCPLCDTDYTSQRVLKQPMDIVDDVDALNTSIHIRSGRRMLVVITGGEPLRQNLRPLVHRLIENEYDVQIETNGTIFDAALPFFCGREVFSVVCSPKTPRIDDRWWPHLSAVKYVLTSDQISPEDGLPESVLGMSCRPARVPDLLKSTIPIYLQPADEQDEEKNQKNLAATLTSCFHYGYRLCLQTHKMIGLP